MRLRECVFFRQIGMIFPKIRVFNVRQSDLMMPIAREGLREITLAALVCGSLAYGATWLAWPAAIPFVLLFVWVLLFFRDPKRVCRAERHQLCSPADGTITEITELANHDAIGGPAIRIGMFLSLMNVHINRMPCSGTVRSLAYRAGEFLDARHPESGKRNESNTLLIDPDDPMPGPVEVRQVAGFLARRIICHARADERLEVGARFGLIKFGSRTELVIPRLDGTKVLVSLGSKVRAGVTMLAEQPVSPSPTSEPSEDSDRHSTTASSQTVTSIDS